MSRSHSWFKRFIKRLSPTTQYRRSRAVRRRSLGLEGLESRALLSASPIGSEFLVNTFTENGQLFSSMAMDADGDFVVAWHSYAQDGDFYGVYAQRYNAAGVAQGEEFRVNSTTSSIQIVPSVAMDADGDFVIVWSSFDQDGSDYGVYAQRYNAAGVPQAGEFRVNTATANAQGRPSVAMDADGDFVVAWQSNGQDGSGYGIYAQRYNASGAIVGGEFRVNTTTAGHQVDPSVALDANGDFVIAWSSADQDGSGFGVYAQRYNALGEVQGSEFRVNTHTPSNQEVPSVSMDADGDFVVTWQSYDQDGDTYGIYAQRYNSAGIAQGTEFRVNATALGSQLNPTVAMDANGDFLVTWSSVGQDGSAYGVYAQAYNAAGLAQGVEFLVNTFTTGNQIFPSVAMDADGDFVVTWTSDQDGSGFGIYAQRYNESTTTSGPMVTEVRDLDRRIVPGGRLSSTLDTLTVVFSEDLNVVGGSSGANSILNPANWRLTQDGVEVISLIIGITFEPNIDTGKYEADLMLGAPLSAATYRLTVLDTIRGLNGNALDGDLNGVPGGSFSHTFAIANVQAANAEFRINTLTTNAQGSPSVAMDADGDYVVTWESFGQDGDRYGIYAQRYNAAGAPQGVEFRVNTFTANHQEDPSVAMDTDGDFVVTWQSNLQDGGGYGVYAQRYNAAGVPQGVEFRVNTFTTDNQTKPSVAMDADGDFVVTWQSTGQDGSNFGVYAQRYNAAGVAQGSEFRVNTFTTGNQSFPSVAMDADGDFVVTWHSNFSLDGISYNIYAQRYNAAGVAQGGEFRVNASAIDYQLVPSVAMDANGDFVVAWEGSRQDGIGLDVYAQRYNAAGVAQGGEFRVNTFATGNQGAAAVAMDADGEFIVTWTSDGQDGSGYGVYAQRYNAAGVAQGGEFRVNTFTTGDQGRASVAMDADGDFLVAWQSNGQDGSGTGIYAQRYQSDAPVQLTTGVLSLTGTHFADVMSVERIAPAGSPAYLNAVRNGVSFSFDPTKVTYIAMNGSTGDDWLGIGSNVTTPTTLIGGGGNDTLIGGAGTDILNGGTGNDLYVFDTDSTLGFDILTDTSGNDTLDFSNTSSIALSVNLGVTTTQVVNANHSLRLMSTTAIENMIGGALGDTLIGNSLANRLTGGGGDDTLAGGSGNDTYLFDADLFLGADTIDEAGGGIDTLDFSATSGKNIAINLSSSVVQNVAAGTLTLNLSAGNTIENVIGGFRNNTMTGNSLNNLLVGGPGDDNYNFDSDLALGADTIQDSGGVDTLNFSTTTTQAVAVNLSSSAAQVVTPSRLTLTLSSGNAIENVIGGSLGDTLTGNALHNTLTGGGGSDLLSGDAGDDTYLFDTDLALGSDTIIDFSGTDTLDFSATTTRAVTVNLSNPASQVVNLGLSLTLTSSTSMEYVIGGSLGDTITGNALANRITGGPGNDILTGGAGNDTYVFDADSSLGSDTINEAGGGVDTLDFSDTTTRALTVNLSTAASQVVSPTLSLILSAGNTIENVIGGALGDTLIGNSLANSFTGGGGNDTLTGAAGDDTYLFNTDFVLGSDTINEAGGGIDTLDFGSTLTRTISVNLAAAGAQVVTSGRLTLTLGASNTMENVIGGALGDSLTGNTLGNRLTGGAGNDLLIGGAGNDLYEFDTDLDLGSDTIDEAGGGVDTLLFNQTTTRTIAVDLSLATIQTINAGLMLTLSSGSTIENAVGGALGDTLIGNTLANRLTGGGGNDLLIGDYGDDTYLFDTDLALGSDTIIDANGVDTLDFSLTTTRRVLVDLSLATPQVINDGLTLTLSAINAMENAVGGALSDILIGNSLANTLTGNDGDDVLSGQAGDDNLMGGSGKNILIGGFGKDQLTGGSGEDLILGARFLLENDVVALSTLRDEWTSSSSFLDRVGHLLGTLGGGVNGGLTLTPATVKEDFAQDTLIGGSGRDWYFRNSLGANTAFQDTLTDADVDSVFEEISTWL